MNRLVIALTLWLLPIPAASQGVGSLTLMDGSVRVIRGTNVLKGIEGMRLRPGDILESSDAGFTQLEFTGGAIVAIGPSSHLYIYRHPGDRIAGSKWSAGFAARRRNRPGCLAGTRGVRGMDPN